MIAVGVGVGVLVLSLILVLLLRMRASRGHISTSPRPSLGPSDRKFKSWLSTISKLSSAFSRLSQGILLLHFFPLCLALILSGISNLEKLQICYDFSGYSFHFPVNIHPGAKISSQRKAITVEQIMSQKGYQCQRS